MHILVMMLFSVVGFGASLRAQGKIDPDMADGKTYLSHEYLDTATRKRIKLTSANSEQKAMIDKLNSLEELLMADPCFAHPKGFDIYQEGFLGLYNRGEGSAASSPIAGSSKLFMYEYYVALSRDRVSYNGEQSPFSAFVYITVNDPSPLYNGLDIKAIGDLKGFPVYFNDPGLTVVKVGACKIYKNKRGDIFVAPAAIPLVIPVNNEMLWERAMEYIRQRMKESAERMSGDLKEYGEEEYKLYSETLKRQQEVLAGMDEKTRKAPAMYNAGMRHMIYGVESANSPWPEQAVYMLNPALLDGTKTGARLIVLKVDDVPNSSLRRRTYITRAKAMLTRIPLNKLAALIDP